MKHWTWTKAASWVVATLLMLPMATPAAFAFLKQTDELRPPAEREDVQTRGAIERALSGPISPEVLRHHVMLRLNALEAQHAERGQEVPLQEARFQVVLSALIAEAPSLAALLSPLARLVSEPDAERITATLSSLPVSPEERTILTLAFPPVQPRIEAAETGKTFIAVTAPGMTVDGPTRKWVDSQTNILFPKLFDRDQTVQRGPGTPDLDDQVATKADRTLGGTLGEEVDKAYQALLEAADGIGGQVADQFHSRRMVFFTNDNDPALWSDGEMHLVGLSGNYQWRGKDSPGSHYAKLGLFRYAPKAFGESGALAFRQAWIRHETRVLNVGGYFPPTDDAERAQWEADERTLNNGFAKIDAEYLADEAAKDAKRFRISIVSANLGKQLDNPEILPDAAAEAARMVLDDAIAKGQITDKVVVPNGDKLVIMVSHNRGHENPAVFALQQRAFSAALTAGAVALSQEATRRVAEASEKLRDAQSASNRRIPLLMKQSEEEKDAEKKASLGREIERARQSVVDAEARLGAAIHDEQHPAPARLSAARAVATGPSEQQAIDLELQPLEFALTERGSDPMFLVLSQNTAEGWANEAIWKHAVINPSQGRVENVPGYRFVVSDVHEQRLGAATRRDLVFDMVYGGGQAQAAMRGIAAAPEGWAIRRVDPAQFPGRRAPDEPLLVVSGERVGGGKATDHMVVGRSQSGYPAVGEWLKWFTDPGYVPGGKNSQHLVPIRPSTLPEIARRLPQDQAAVALIEWQTYENGKFRPIKDAVSHSQHLQLRRDRNDKPMYDRLRAFPELQEFDPFMLVDAAQERARVAREANLSRFIQLPEPGSADYAANLISRLIERANQASGGNTVSRFKIDVGGDPGHQEPPVIYMVALNASIRKAIEDGLIVDGRAYAIGDDVQIEITHNKGINNAEIHSLAWYTFMRAAWIAKVLNRKPYGWAQDLPIFTAEKTGEELLRDVSAESKLDPRFMQLLAEELRKVEEKEKTQTLLPEQREPVAEDLTILSTWWTHYQAGRLVKVTMVGGEVNVQEVKGAEGATTFTGPPAGNVTGQGIGSVEVPLMFADGKPVELTGWGLDKAGPGAFNWPVYFMIYYGQYFEDEIKEFMSLFQVAQEPNAAFTKEWLNRELERLWKRVQARAEKIADKGVDGILREGSDRPVILELWDTRNKQAIFLDANKDRKLIRDLLVAENWFSPRRIWIKQREGWDVSKSEQLMDVVKPAFEADFSTERLSEVKGKSAKGTEVKSHRYLGKDDPAALLMRQFAERLEFFVGFFGWLIQGDERGSHDGDPMPGAPFSPDPARRPIPTVRSYMVQAAIDYTVQPDLSLAKVVDVFDNPTYEARRALSMEINEAILPHDEFPPQGVSPGKQPLVEGIKGEAYIVASAETPTQARLVLWSGGVSEEPHSGVQAAAEKLIAGIRHGSPDVLVTSYERPSGEDRVEIGLELNGPRAQEIAEVVKDHFNGYHGKVEAAYPLAQAVAETVAEGSKYVRERDVTITEAVREGKWAQQYDTIGESLSPAQVRQAADVTVTTTVLIHPTAFGEGPLAERLERWLKDQARQLHEPSVDAAVKHSAVKLMIQVPPIEGVQGPARVAQFFKDLKSDLKPEWFTVVTDAPASVTVAFGPSAWIEQAAAGAVVKMTVEPSEADDKVRSVVAAFDAALEAAASPDKKLPPPLARKFDLDVLGVVGVFSARERDITAEREVHTYRATARQAVQKL